MGSKHSSLSSTHNMSADFPITPTSSDHTSVPWPPTPHNGTLPPNGTLSRPLSLTSSGGRPPKFRPDAIPTHNCCSNFLYNVPRAAVMITLPGLIVLVIGAILVGCTDHSESWFENDALISFIFLIVGGVWTLGGLLFWFINWCKNRPRGPPPPRNGAVTSSRHGAVTSPGQDACVTSTCEVVTLDGGPVMLGSDVRTSEGEVVTLGSELMTSDGGPMTSQGEHSTLEGRFEALGGDHVTLGSEQMMSGNGHVAKIVEDCTKSDEDCFMASDEGGALKMEELERHKAEEMGEPPLTLTESLPTVAPPEYTTLF